MQEGRGPGEQSINVRSRSRSSRRRKRERAREFAVTDVQSRLDFVDRILKEKEVDHVSSSAESISVEEDSEARFCRSKSVPVKRVKKRRAVSKTKAAEKTRAVGEKNPEVERHEVAEEEPLVAADPLVLGRGEEFDPFEMDDLRQQLDAMAEERRRDQEEGRNAMVALQAQLQALMHRFAAVPVPAVQDVPEPVLDQAVAAVGVMSQTQMAVTRASIGSLAVYDGPPHDLDAWIDSLEAVADQGGLSDLDRLRLATSKFGPMLLTWLRTVRREEGAGLTWGILQERMRGEYGKKFVKKVWAEEVFKARQKLDEEFEPYHRRMVVLLAENPTLTAAERAEEVIDGLKNTSLRAMLRHSRYGSVAEAVEGIRGLSRDYPALVRSQQAGRTGPAPKPGTGGASQKSVGFSGQPGVRKDVCFHCQQPGHFARECPKKKSMQGNACVESLPQVSPRDGDDE